MTNQPANPTRDTWPLAIAGYTTSMQAAGRSPGTVRLHRHYLSSLAETTPSPAAVTMADLERMLSPASWAPETRKSARSAVRSFFRWATRAGIVPADPAAELTTVRIPRATARPTPETAVEAALASANPRVRVMVMLAAYAGLRCAEIARVHTADLTGDVLRVHGKGGVIRDVPLTHDALAALTDYLPAVPGWVFPGRSGHLTPGHVTKLLSRALPTGWTGHTLRHRMASAAYAGTRDLLAVGALLGHSRPETTQRYVRMPDDAVRAAVRAASPRHLIAVPSGPPTLPGPIPDCPTWCTLPAGHEYELQTYSGTEVIRTHERQCGDVWIGQAETALTPAGPVDPHPDPALLVTRDGTELTPARARELAAHLLEAADMADQITATR